MVPGFSLKTNYLQRVKHDWSKVIHVFDWPDRQGVDTNTLKLLIAILVNSPRDVEKPAVSGFWSQ